MFCSNCGTANVEDATFCTQCGRPLVVAAPSASSPGYPAAPPSRTGTAYAPQLFYAGFWLRFVAYLIDSVILCIVYVILIVVVIFASGVAAMLRNLPENPTPDMFLHGALVVAILTLIAITTVITWLYYAWMESSPSQGTLGKMAMGLIVTDMQYRPVSFARATARFFAKIITGLIPFCIGYIMAGFTAKKQALHDMIASCLVLRKS
ncbi:MAG TPA: RDD family protein [Candidatus Acidoferrales bacterium]|nr:RDD family protein [Candidatus Acidoferrales bacterium]